MKEIRKIIYSIFLLLIMFSSNIVYAENIEINKLQDEQKEKGNVTYAADVTSEMAESSYWISLLGEDADKILLTSDEIAELNQSIIDGEGTDVWDITTITERKTQTERKQSLIDSIDADFSYMNNYAPELNRKLYANGELIDNTSYINKIKDAVKNTGFENEEEKIQLYAVGVTRTELKIFPTNSIWGYDSPNDPDDEASLTPLDVNEPFVIRAKCELDGDTFYWGYTNSSSGWVNAKYLALFDSKEEWLDAWQVDLTENNFLVVTQDNITLPSTNEELSNIELKLGTVLKLIPEDEIKDIISEEEVLNNYIVYLPTRNEDGKYEKSYAFIPEHNQVSIGYLPSTERNILNVAFNALGNRYGWGGMIGAMDCSSYVKAIYKTFGIDLPRNTTTQRRVPNKVEDISNMQDKEKEAYIETLPIGTPLYFSGHTMIYIGNKNNTSYVISATGSLADSYGEIEIKSMNSIIINPLTVRRRNGKT